MAHGISVRRFRSTHSLTAVLGQLRVVVVESSGQGSGAERLRCMSSAARCDCIRYFPPITCTYSIRVR